MHKRIMVKIRGSKKVNQAKKRQFYENIGIYKFSGAMGKFINFVKIG